MARCPHVLALAAAIAALAAPAAFARSGGPPVPTVLAGAAKTQAAVGTSCWTQGTQTNCSDAGLPTPRAALPVRAGQVVVVDFGTPATSVSVDRGGRTFADATGVRASRRHAGWTRWRFRVPPGLHRATNLVLFAIYPQGNAVFGVRIAPRR